MKHNCIIMFNSDSIVRSGYKYIIGGAISFQEAEIAHTNILLRSSLTKHV
jgi:hypothetical protein